MEKVVLVYGVEEKNEKEYFKLRFKQQMQT